MVLWLTLGVALAQDPEPTPDPPPAADPQPAPEQPAQAPPKQQQDDIPRQPPNPPVRFPSGLPPAPGSLWNESQARMLVGLDGSARSIGDLVTVVIVEESQTSISADTSTSSSGSNAAGISALFGLKQAIVSANDNMGGELGVGTDRAFSYDGSGDTSRQSMAKGTLTCKVTEVLPNGNLMISGVKSVRTNHETQNFTISGEIRPQDIQTDNRILSSYIANAKVEVTGQGVLNDDQRVPFGTRVLKAVWPF